MTCYFWGCTAKGTTREHIPPRAFFPEDEREQLLTVRSCDLHNGRKSTDDLYVLAQICMNASPNNRAREIFMERVAPQLSHNNGALRKLLTKDAQPVSGGVIYPVDIARFDEFFTALSCGLIFKYQKMQLPPAYQINHIYHQLVSHIDENARKLERAIDAFYGGKPMGGFAFGTPDARNQRIYTVDIFGVPRFQSSITIVHIFFGVFKVTSMLSRAASPNGEQASVRKP
jgi:hypothetical protein